MTQVTVDLAQAEQLVTQLAVSEQLKLITRICEKIGISVTKEQKEWEEEEKHQSRLKLAEELLAECEDVKDDSRGEYDSAKELREIREGRLNQLCQNGA